jgi:hypothetical protein
MNGAIPLDALECAKGTSSEEVLKK